MIGRRALLAIALLCGALAGIIYYASLQRVSVVVAARSLDADKAIAFDDLATKELPPDAVPAGAVRSTDDAVGRVPRAPLWPGQVLVAGALATGAAAFHSGIVPPAGQRAIAIPVTPSQAIGGAIVAGAHVDVIAVPVIGRAPAGRVTELVAANVTVLDVRGRTAAHSLCRPHRAAASGPSTGSAASSSPFHPVTSFGSRIGSPPVRSFSCSSRSVRDDAAAGARGSRQLRSRA